MSEHKHGLGYAIALASVEVALTGLKAAGATFATVTVLRWMGVLP